MRSALLDAGPLIALFAADDKHHARFDRLVSTMSGEGLRLLTTCGMCAAKCLCGAIAVVAEDI